MLKGNYIESSGAAPRVQPWTAHYDEYGRLIGRTDYNAANRAAGVPDTHYHRFEYGPGYNPYWQDPLHYPGEYTP
jgi:hypothetical protein